MTFVTKNTATAALIALMSAAPLAASQIQSGSPAQSVENDPDEYVASDNVTTNSVVADLGTGSPAQSVDTDPAEEVANDGAGEGTLADELPTNSPAVSD